MFYFAKRIIWNVSEINSHAEPKKLSSYWVLTSSRYCN